MLGKYVATPTALADGELAHVQIDATGSLQLRIGLSQF